MSITINAGRDTFEEVIIGTQTWMKRNYDFGGTVYNNTTSNIPIYGKLYTWDEATAIDFPGWHLPSVSDFNTLVSYIGGATLGGLRLKEVGTTHWTTETGATDSYGFMGVPGGYYTVVGGFMKLNLEVIFWTSEAVDTLNARSRHLQDESNSIISGEIYKSIRCSVRLIKN
jgi:uncharacterized protein (TIGR02145 family)